MCEKSKLQREIERLLGATNLVWSIEQKRRHKALIIAGRQVAVISNGSASGRDAKMIASIIRRVQT